VQQRNPRHAGADSPLPSYPLQRPAAVHADLPSTSAPVVCNGTDGTDGSSSSDSVDEFAELEQLEQGKRRKPIAAGGAG
jgi:hypothetical protein